MSKFRCLFYQVIKQPYSYQTFISCFQIYQKKMEKQTTPLSQGQLIQKPTIKNSLLYKVLTTILAIAISAAWIFFSKHYLTNSIKNHIFSKNPLKNFDDTLGLLATIGLYAAIYLVSLTFLVMLIRIFSHSINPAVMQRLQPAQKTNELIRNFTHALIIFFCLFLYFLENSKKSIKTSCGYILPIWFLSGYAALWVGNLLELLFKRQLGIGKAGYLIVLTNFVVILAQINGFKLYKLI